MAGVEKNARILSIESTLNDNNIVINIADTGIGIDETRQQ